MLIRYCLLLAGLLSAAQLEAQIELIRGLPLEATRTQTVNDESNNYSVSGRVARSSNGSTYEEYADHRTGEIFLIKIIDMVERRAIFLEVKRKFYSIQPMPDIKVGDAPSNEALQRNIELLRTSKPTHESDDNGTETETTPLGFRTQKGLLEYGRRMTYSQLPTSSSLKAKIWED
jgi:hypothetical protein